MWTWLRRQHPAHAAISDFISATIRRSGLHQLVFAGLFAAGIALAANALFGAVGLRERWVVRAALGTPFTVMAGAVVGLHLALRLPTNIRAGWVFRFLENAETRPHQLDAVRSALFTRGVLWPLALTLPVQAYQLGPRTALTLAPITALVGWAFTEAMCLGWRRLPYTCTFLFAKRPPAFTVAALIAIFGWFVFAGTSLLDTARLGALPWFIVATLVVSVGTGLRSYRRVQWGQGPLEFEDYLPDSLDQLRLHE